MPTTASLASGSITVARGRRTSTFPSRRARRPSRSPRQRRLLVAGFVALATLAAGTAPAARASAQSDRSRATFTEWARSNAVPLRPVDDPYADSSFDFLRTLVGSARVLSLGELIHRGHEPLDFRNEVIRYAVTHLGFTAVALESGFTEAAVIDRFIQGGPGDVDSILRAGLSWNFGTLAENRELVLWLRAYNARATRHVRFYGFDLTGADPANLADLYLGAPLAATAALAYLDQTAPATGATLASQLTPLMDRFTPYRYEEFSPGERRRLRAALERLHRTLVAPAATETAAGARFARTRARAREARNAWMALRLDALLALTPSSAPLIARARTPMRDSLMAENVRWILGNEGDSGRLVVFAHNAHVMNAPGYMWTADTGGLHAAGPPFPMAGQHLRRWLGPSEVVIIATTSKTVGWGVSPSDPNSVDAALAPVGLPIFVVDLRRSARRPDIARLLERPWPLRMQTRFVPVAPLQATDAIVYFDQVTAESRRTGD